MGVYPKGPECVIQVKDKHLGQRLPILQKVWNTSLGSIAHVRIDIALGHHEKNTAAHNSQQ